MSTGTPSVTQPEGSLHVCLLGPFRVRADGVVVEPERWSRRKCTTLVKLLALSPGYEIHRDEAMERLWPRTSADTAANNLNKIILLTRRALEPGLASGGASRFVQRVADRVRLAGDPLVVDVASFEEASRRAAGGEDPSQYDDALALYAGDLLAEDRYEDWAHARRERLRLRYLDLLQGAADSHVARGESTAAIERLIQLLEHEPANEEAHRRLMRLHAQAGHRDKALRQFEACRDALRREVDAEPDEATVELYRGLSTGAETTVAEPAIEPGVAPRASAANDRLDSDEPTLAVLPFRNESDDAELDYLVDGVTETLIHNLSELPRLRVLARSTVFRAVAPGADPLSVARELDADVALIGRVVQFSERLSVGVELVRVADGALQWGERFDRPSADIFAVEEEISRDISRKLRLKLTRVDENRLGRRQTESTEAYQDYLRGRFFWNKRTDEAIRRAIGYFESALDHDPAYARAYSGLADGYNLLGLYGVEPPRSVMPRAKAAAEQALRIDDTLAEAWTSLAYARFYYDWDFRRSEEDFRTALDANDGYATAHHWYHELLTACGRFEEAREQIGAAESLDPLSVIIKTDVGWGRYFARDFDRAAGLLRESLDMDPRFAVARLVLGLATLESGDADRAIAEIDEAIRITDGPFPLALGALGHACGRAGREDRAHGVLGELAGLSSRGYVPDYCEAMIRTGLGEADMAIELLTRAVEARYDRLVYLRVDPVFDALRSHAGFQQILDRIAPAT